VAEQRLVLGLEEGRLVLKPDLAAGFTLVELLVGISIVAVLLALGAPAMGTYLQNSKLANATASYYSGIQAARSEAIRRNILTQFVLTDTPFSTPDLANAVAPSTGGRSWVVRAASGPGNFVQVDAKDASEGQGGIGPAAIQVAGSASGVVFDGTISFNGFGRTTSGESYSVDVTNPAAGLCKTAGGSIRCRRLTVSAGGQIAACDPAASAAIGDSRAC
jgi:type IV fimbrial biogenesis protein FimT